MLVIECFAENIATLGDFVCTQPDNSHENTHHAIGLKKYVLCWLVACLVAVRQSSSVNAFVKNVFYL